MWVITVYPGYPLASLVAEQPQSLFIKNVALFNGIHVRIAHLVKSRLRK